MNGSDPFESLSLRCMSLRIFILDSFLQKHRRHGELMCRKQLSDVSGCGDAFGCDVKGFIRNDDPAVCVSVCAPGGMIGGYADNQCLEEFVLTHANITLSVRRAGFAATLSFYIMTDVRFETGFLQNNRHLLPTFSPVLPYKNVPLF